MQLHNGKLTCHLLYFTVTVCSSDVCAESGKKHGQGAYVNKSGNRYVGGWFDDRRSGRGCYQWAAGDVYEGETNTIARMPLRAVYCITMLTIAHRCFCALSCF